MHGRSAPVTALATIVAARTATAGAAASCWPVDAWLTASNRNIAAQRQLCGRYRVAAYVAVSRASSLPPEDEASL